MEFHEPLRLEREDAQSSKELAGKIGLPVLVAELLCRRGMVSEGEVRAFLSPKLADLPSPFDLKGMDDAVREITGAVFQKRPVIVHGDYDVDGVAATALLVEFFDELGMEVDYHLPDRLSQGYGLSMDSVAQLAGRVTLPALFITADCGINDHKEVRYAKELGFTVIVTDHHECCGQSVTAHAVINPKQKGCGFACKELAGAGVAFFLIMAIRSRLVADGYWDRGTAPNLKKYLDLVALGTVADVVDLLGVNRILVKAGIEVLAERKRVGTRVLCAQAGLNEKILSGEDIAYRLAPRLNAAGRLGKPHIAAELLLCKDEQSASKLAVLLEGMNAERREIEKLVLCEAMKQAEEQVAGNRKGLVVVGPNWHLGVLGIIASRLVDRFTLPIIVLSADAASDCGALKGSGRSVDGVDLYGMLEQCSESLVAFGGHKMAGGLTVSQELVEDFAERFDGCVKQVLKKETPEKVAADAVIDRSIDCTRLAESLQLLEPFGRGNPAPVWLMKEVRLERLGAVGEHLKFVLQANGSMLHGIGFFMGQSREELSGLVDIGFKLRKTIYRGQERVEAHAVALKPSG